MKDWKEIKKEIQEIDFTDFGDEILDAVNESDNDTKEIGRHALLTIDSCETEREFDLVDWMFTAITGWSIETIMNRVMGIEEGEE